MEHIKKFWWVYILILAAIYFFFFNKKTKIFHAGGIAGGGIRMPGGGSIPINAGGYFQRPSSVLIDPTIKMPNSCTEFANDCMGGQTAAQWTMHDCDRKFKKCWSGIGIL